MAEGEGEFNLFCVRKNGSSGDTGASKAMFEAFSSVKEEGFTPQWLFESDCLKVKKKEKNTAYLFDQFEGEGFKHVLSLKCRILGPQCILSSLQHKMDIPRKSSPIMNLAMKDLDVCCSNLPKETRNELHEKIELMGGETSRTLTDDVTHLIAGEVGSKKYQVCGELGKQIMLPEWVDAVWKKAAEGHVHASDGQFSKFQCPVFYGLVITASGFDGSERQEIKKLVESEGGKYTGEMKVKECTHLIINKPKGQKYEFAKKWMMHIIKSDWLYDSVEKGYCLEESKYRLEDGESGVKTSTPEKGPAKSRVSSIADISSISNISMINPCQINETAATTRVDYTTFNETQPPKQDIESSIQAIDLTRPPSDLFLDGCKIYLSGFRGQALEKMRKVINTGGATRLNQLNEAVTHVILGEKIERDIQQLMSGQYRPKVVSPAWLAECYRNGKTVDEAPFSCLEIPTTESESPKPKSRQKKQDKMDSTQNKTIEPEVTKMEDNDQQDEIDIMSQYMLQPEPAQVVPEGGIEQNQMPVPCDNEVETADNEDHETTKNPELDSQGQKKVFVGKTFMLFGFVEEQITDLVDFVTQEGGKVYQGNTRLVPDYGIVPIDGFPVDKTVGEIATSTWLQMCVEYEAVLPVSSNPLFSPVDINIENNPLADCVLSFSGWSGTEKDCLMHIAECVGAGTQEYFVRNAKNGLLPTTHLITKEASGQKYTAAKKWGIPALSKMWIIACAKSGKREPEENYLIDNEQNDIVPENKTLSSATAQTLNESQKQKSSDQGGNQLNEQNQSKLNSSVRKDDKVQSAENNSLSSASKTADVSKQKNNLSVGMETMAAIEGFCSEMTMEADLPADRSKENLQQDNEVDDMERTSQKPFQESQKENVGHKQTPIQSKVLNNRVKALQNDEFESTPKNNPRRASVNSPSPGRFLDPTKEFKPKFDLTDVMKLLETPPAEKARNVKRRESLPLDELFSQKLQKAIEITSKPAERREGDEVDGCGTSSTLDGLPLSQHVGPLTGVVIAVSKKLPNQGEYNDTVAALGGDYRWTYDKSCTHFIYQSNRANDTAKEFRTARDHKKLIVSPHWLLMCKEQNAWVDESLFPHNYNPNLTLSVSRKRTGTPARTPARATRKTRGNAGSESGSDLQPETLNFDKDVNKVTKNARVQSLRDSDKEVVSESDTDNELKSRLGQGQSDTKAEIRSRLGQGVKVEEGTKGGKRSRQSNKNEDQDPEGVQPTTGSMEMREVLSKELENIMLSEKSKKTALRRRSKRLNCSGNISGELSSSTEKINSSRQNRWSLQDEKPEKKTPTSSDKSVENNSHPEPSQSVQVTWDDHTGRLEQEKLAHKLERACSPTQDVAEFLDGEFSSDDEDVDYDQLENPQSELPQQEKVEERVPTPEGPSLAFHKSNNNTEARVPSPEPIEIQEDREENVQKPPPVFIMSGLSQAEKDDYGALVEQLGGKVLESIHFDSSCTHLVIGTPTRNEKYLASVASGKWVLHKSYFEACRQEKRFVQEDFYEWGGEGTRSLLSNRLSSNLAAAAYRWRVRVQSALQSGNHCPGAFDGWKVILSCDKSKDDNFKRLLEAGGATVLPNKPPFEENITATHAFLDLNRKPLDQSNLQTLVNNRILCLKPEYIAAHLTDEPPPNTDDFCPSEVYTVLSMSSTGSERNKRKALSLSSTSDGESRSKRTRKR